MAAAPPPPRAAPPPQKKERAATHGIRFWLKKLPGWKGHHKFYIGLISLLAVTVWLVIALFVWGVEFPEDIVGCAAVVFEVTLKVGLFAFIFQRYVAGEGPVVAPTDPELEAIDDWLGRHDDAAAAFLERVNVRGPGMAKAPSVFGLGAGVVGVPEGDVAVVDDVACGALGCGLAD